MGSTIDRGVRARHVNGKVIAPGSFEELVGGFSALDGRVFDPDVLTASVDLTGRHLAFGLRIGLVTGAASIEIETARARRGLPQDGLQAALSLRSRGEKDAAADALSSLEVRLLLADDHVVAFWSEIILGLLLRRWSTGVGDPVIEGDEIFAGWGDAGDRLWRPLRPRGRDALYFGTSARRRLLERVRRRLDATSGADHAG